jgi:protein SCO1/2
MKKFVLFLLIGLPVIIFLFLKFFGVNQHDIPVFYTQGVDTTFTSCNFGAAPHYVPQFTFGATTQPQKNNFDGNVIYYLSQADNSTTSQKIKNELRRIEAMHSDWDRLNIVLLRPNSSGEEEKSEMREIENSLIIYMGVADSTSIKQFARCGLILDFDYTDVQINNTLVLVDEQRRIRGYYDALDLDEVDRLMLELKILKSNNE